MYASDCFPGDPNKPDEIVIMPISALNECGIKSVYLGRAIVYQAR